MTCTHYGLCFGFSFSVETVDSPVSCVFFFSVGKSKDWGITFSVSCRSMEMEKGKMAEKRSSDAHLASILQNNDVALMFGNRDKIDRPVSL